MHFNKAISLFPILLHASNANSISSTVAIPVDKIIGLNKIPQDLQVSQVMGDDWTYPNDIENRLKEYNSK